MGIIRDHDAQFMLLAGFIVAIGLMTTTVMLNSIIFEGNMAVDTGTYPSKNEIIGLMQITRDETRAAYGNATAWGTRTMMTSSFINQTQNFRANLSTIYALHGESVNVAWDISNWNNGIYANFTDNGTADGASNWTVVENVKDSNITITTNGSIFQIGLINSSARWINLTTSGTFSFRNSTTLDPFSIVFRNGDATSGNYSITGKLASGKNFTRARDYVLNATVTFYTSRVGANITVPVSVPW